MEGDTLVRRKQKQDEFFCGYFFLDRDCFVKSAFEVVVMWSENGWIRGHFRCNGFLFVSQHTQTRCEIVEFFKQPKLTSSQRVMTALVPFDSTPMMFPLWRDNGSFPNCVAPSRRVVIREWLVVITPDEEANVISTSPLPQTLISWKESQRSCCRLHGTHSRKATCSLGTASRVQNELARILSPAARGHPQM